MQCTKLGALLLVGSSLLVMWMPGTSPAEEKAALPDLKGWRFSDADAYVIEHGDLHAASKVVGKIWILREKEGDEAVRAAVPAMVNRLRELQQRSYRLSPDHTEAEGEFELNLLALLSEMGDERAKSVLLEGMKHGRGATTGLLAIGRSVLPDILDSLSSARSYMRIGAVITLITMTERDTTFLTNGDRREIQETLVALTERATPLARIAYIPGLGVFGDASTIPLLEQIAETDTLVVSGRYYNRARARSALEKLRAALQGAAQE